MNIDIIKKDPHLWNIFTLRYEYTSGQLKKKNSQNDHTIIDDPKISAHLLKNGIEFNYPDNKPFGVCLTHDVDEIYPPVSHIAYSSVLCLKNRDISLLKKFLLGKNKNYSPYWNFKKIVNIEQKYDAVSSFYIISSPTDIKRFRYNVEDLEEELGNVTDLGCEVGLHGGYYSCNDPHAIKTEKERLESVLGKKIIGYRNHYLQFSIPDTWEILQDLGFTYDTTLGYNEGIGFRNGMCHPFRPYNLITEKSMDILEIPLIIMDVSLFLQTKNFDIALATAKKMIDTVERLNGIITLNWHSNTFNCPFKRDWERIYEKILVYCYKKNAWLTNGCEITHWWKTNAF